MALAIAAHANVTFDPTGSITPSWSSGAYGFVGKGDVQTALGFNNAKMQAEINNVQFTYVSQDTYEVVNAWASGNADNPVSLNYHEVTVTTVVNLNDTLAYNPRQSPNQYTGFDLTGISSVAGGTVPVVSPTVTYVTFSWNEQVWTGEWTQVPKLDKDGNQVYDKDGNPVYQNGDKIYDTVTHTTDQLPVDENGNLYTEGDNKAVLSVTLLSSIGNLFVSDGSLGPVSLLTISN